MKIDNYSYREEYKEIENCFIQENLKENRDLLKKNFFKKGFYLNKSESLNTDHLVQDFQAFSSIFGCEIIHDANRRKKYKFKNTQDENLSSVDIGANAINPHSEASFSPIRPAIIAFLCLNISPEAKLSGLTTFIDGAEVWKNLNVKTKKEIQSLVIKYSVEIDLNIKKNLKGNTIPSYLDYSNVSNVMLNTREAKLKFIYNSPFVHEHPLTRDLCLTNHAFVDLKQESQIRKKEFILNGESFNFSSDIVKDIFDSMHKNTFTHKWQKGESIVIDNFRFMHGRLKFNEKHNRELIIRQLKKFKI